MHERGLHVHAQQYPEPDEVYAQFFCDRAQQGDDDEGQLEKIEEEGQHEHQDVDDDEEAQLAAGQAGQQVFDPDVAVDAVEGQAEHTRTNEDEHHKGGELGSRVHGLLEQAHRQAPAPECHEQRPGGAHRAALGGRRHAEKNRAEHKKDQRQRRDEHEGHAHGDARQQAQLEHMVQHRGDECESGADRG